MYPHFIFCTAVCIQIISQWFWMIMISQLNLVGSVFWSIPFREWACQVWITEKLGLCCSWKSLFCCWDKNGLRVWTSECALRVADMSHKCMVSVIVDTPSPKQPFSFLGQPAINSARQPFNSVPAGAWLCCLWQCLADGTQWRMGLQGHLCVFFGLHCN